MSTNVTFNGTSYQVPQTGDTKWGAYTSRFLTALGTYALAPSGGTFTLTGDVNFGAAFGLLSAYFSTRAASPASAGLLRLANGDSIQWRNHAGGGNNVLNVDSSDNITWNGVVLNTALNTLSDGKIWIGNASNTPIANTLTGDVTVDNTGVTSIGAGKIVNSQVSNSAAIAYSKLSLTASVVNADIGASAAIAYSKLNLATSIVNGDIAASTINLTTKVTGTLPVANGGTGVAASTGTVAVVLSTSPTLVTPILGAASATSISFSSTTGVIGSTTNDAAAAGSVGETISSQIGSGSPTSLSTGTAKNVTSINVTAGDWDIFGVVGYIPGGTVSWLQQSIGTTSATADNEQTTTITSYASATTLSLAALRFPCSPARFSFSTTTTVYLIAQATFGTSMGAFGTITARRRR